MCCCDICLEIAVEALRWVRKIVVENCVNSSEGYKALQQNGEMGVDDGGLRNSTIAVAADCYDCADEVQYNVIVNPKFSEGTKGWFGMGCSLSVVTNDEPSYCIAHGRKENQQGLAQEIGKRLDTDVEYQVEAWVGMRGGKQADCTRVQATVKMQKELGDVYEYILLSSVKVKKGQWCRLTGLLRINEKPRKATVYFDGPDADIDIIVRSVVIVPTTEQKVEVLKKNNDLQIVDSKLRKGVAAPPVFQDPKFEENIVVNSNLTDGLNNWYGMGTCTLNILSGSPRYLGATAQKSFVHTKAPTLSGKYIYTSNRTETYEGPAQDITAQIQLFQSYQLSAWVATTLPQGSTNSVAPQKVNVCLDVDGQWMQGGEVLAGSDWIEVLGTFRLETKPKEVVVYLQGPAAGVDVMLAGLQIFAVDRLARVPLLQKEAEKIRKRDVVLKLVNSQGRTLPPGTEVSVQQLSNSFPIGSCLSHSSLEDESYCKFFLDNFNWAVFENALKWDQVEPEDGDLRYKNADDLARFCNNNNISMRGHCIVWETQEAVPDWVEGLEEEELVDAIEDRIGGLLSRYRGQFKHYDVNNEILHGSFYEEKLGVSFLPYLFQLAHHFDPEADLFVNDYDVTEGGDYSASPERYIDLIRFLSENGAKIGGIGLQGHVEVPIGPILSRALDVLSTLNIPIWFTEIDVASLNEHVRADDLETIFREAFAHPSVEGCLIWGFMENEMSRENAFLVNSDKTLNAAGRRFLELKKEWTTSFEGVVSNNGELLFRGYHGNYSLYVKGKDAHKTFEITKGDGCQELDLTVSVNS